MFSIFIRTINITSIINNDLLLTYFDRLFDNTSNDEAGHRIFANMTFANYWRKSRGCIGEYPPDFRQLANVLGIYWRKSGGDSPILVKAKWTFANTSDSLLDQSLYYRQALHHSNMDQNMLCVRQIGKSPYQISISSVLIIENVVEFRQLANVHMTFAIGESPVGESHIGELPATR